MRRFSAEEVVTVLRAADAHLSTRARLVVIGGTAIGLLANPSRTTTDVDVLPGTELSVLEALQAAKVETGIAVPVERVGVFFAPEGFEERLQPYSLEGLERLEILLPERHDLTLMKLVRGAEHDLQAIELLHQKQPLDPAVLLERFSETWVTGPRSSFVTTYLVLLERLFGAELADAHERALESAG